MFVKMVKEKHGSSKGTGVIQLYHKSVKRVKLSEMDDAKKQCFERQPLESICELLFVISSYSSSSLEMSSEEEQVIAESSSSRMPRKAFTMARKSMRIKIMIINISLAVTLPDPIDLNNLYVPNSKVLYLEHIYAGTWHMDQQVLDN
jgi:hypothetical protein